MPKYRVDVRIDASFFIHAASEEEAGTIVDDMTIDDVVDHPRIDHLHFRVDDIVQVEQREDHVMIIGGKEFDANPVEDTVDGEEN